MLCFFYCLLLTFLILTLSSFSNSNLFYSDKVDPVIGNDMDNLDPVNQNLSDGTDIFAPDVFSTADNSLEPLTSPSLDFSTLDLSDLPSPDSSDSFDFLGAADSSPCVSESGEILSRRQSCSSKPVADPSYQAIPIPLDEETTKKWCSETAVPGFQNIPVCSAEPPYASETDSNFQEQRQIPLSGFINLDKATLSEFDITRFS